MSEHALPLPPAKTRLNGEWQFGRYRAPFEHPELHTSPWQSFRLKEWHYHSVTTRDWFLGLGLVQLGYAATAFLYLVDRRQPHVAPREFESISPLGQALHFAPSSVRGQTAWSRRNERIVMRWQNGWHVALNVPLGNEKRQLQGQFHIQPSEALALLYPLTPKKPAYTHKAAGLATSGELSLGAERISLDGAMATVDWTRSLAKRETRWKWASLVGHEDGGSAVGLNLSTDVYDDERGDSQENAFWLGGKVMPLRGVRFEIPASRCVEPWRIVSRVGDETDLTFYPLGARIQHINLRFVKSDFVQPFGKFEGRVRGYSLHDAFGVVEDHVSIW